MPLRVETTSRRVYPGELSIYNPSKTSKCAQARFGTLEASLYLERESEENSIYSTSTAKPSSDILTWIPAMNPKTDNVSEIQSSISSANRKTYLHANNGE